MGETQEAGIDISSRIKQFSNGATSNLDSNSNFTNKKPNPAPRKVRPKTTEVNYNNNESRSLAGVDKKPLNRTSSNPNTQKRPVVPTKPITPKSVLPPASKNNVLKPNSSNNNNNNNELGKSKANDKNRRTSGEKPALPVKPVIPVKPTNLLTAGDQQNKNKTPVREKSWKQAAGPPRSPLPSGPGVYHNTVITQKKTSSPVPPKPLRGQQKVEVYENNDIDPNNRIKSNRSQCRRETLDGQMILGASSVSADVTPSKDTNASDCKFVFLFVCLF